MRAWKKWNAEWSLRAKSDVKGARQFVKMHKKVYSQYRPHKAFKREYRNLNDRGRMIKKAFELITQRNGVW
jgi:hypothetical protein